MTARETELTQQLAESQHELEKLVDQALEMLGETEKVPEAYRGFRE